MIFTILDADVLDLVGVVKTIDISLSLEPSIATLQSTKRLILQEIWYIQWVSE